MDMTVVLGLNKFSLQATIDHHGQSMYSSRYTTSINSCKNIPLQRQQNTEFEMIISRNASTTHVVLYKLIT